MRGEKPQEQVRGELLEARQVGEKLEAESGWNEKFSKRQMVIGAVDFSRREAKISVGGEGTSDECGALWGGGSHPGLEEGDIQGL